MATRLAETPVNTSLRQKPQQRQTASAPNTPNLFMLYPVVSNLQGYSFPRINWCCHSAAKVLVFEAI
jgi:hypothetical protein